jgi:hypothetical protein
MNWFEKHLNWTLILVYICIYPVLFILGLCTGYILAIIGITITDDILNTIEIVSYIITFIWLVSGTVWYINEKCRSLWWGVLMFIPLGLIWLLLLKNNNINQTKEYIEWTCDGCRAVVKEDDLFCPKCGQHFDEEEQQKSINTKN